jgi:hypothetical protein
MLDILLVGVCKQYRFKKRVKRASSIQRVATDDSIVARRWRVADFFNRIDPLQTLATDAPRAFLL